MLGHPIVTLTLTLTLSACLWTVSFALPSHSIRLPDNVLVPRTAPSSALRYAVDEEAEANRLRVKFI